jgi:hypothetical protein
MRTDNGLNPVLPVPGAEMHYSSQVKPISHLKAHKEVVRRLRAKQAEA